MDVRFGVHAGLQHTSIAELQSLWRRIEELGFDWISIWDHFYAADATGDPHCLEAITAHTALAATTNRVTCGSLVYSAGYRHPAVLANAMATLDQVADGPRRARPRRRLARERVRRVRPALRHRRASGCACSSEYIQCVRGLLTQERTTFDGEFFHLRDAQCEPKPVQARLPIWIGGGGEKVTLRIAAAVRRRLERAVHPARGVGAQGGRARRALREGSGRDPAEITKSVNVGMAFTDEELKRQFGPMSDYVKPGVLSGSVQEMVDKVGAYVDAGAAYVILAMRAPFDRDGLERFAAEVMPAVRG